MFTIYQPKKIKKGKWILEHPENSNSGIGFFKSRKSAINYIIRVMEAIINK